jgi:hypothetical protein
MPSFISFKSLVFSFLSPGPKSNLKFEIKNRRRRQKTARRALEVLSRGGDTRFLLPPK